MIEAFLKLLKFQGFTQEEISRKTGIHQGNISKFSRGGKCSLETVLKFAEVFNVTVDEVLGREKPKPLSRKQEMLLQIVDEDEKLIDSAIKYAEMEKHYEMTKKGAA